MCEHDYEMKFKSKAGPLDFTMRCRHCGKTLPPNAFPDPYSGPGLCTTHAAKTASKLALIVLAVISLLTMLYLR